MAMRKDKIKTKGFTLPEMLISISLGLFLSIMLIKIYLWQDQLHRQMQDLIFLDHNGLLAMQILANTIRSTNKEIKIIQNGHEMEIQEKDNHTDKNIKSTYLIVNHALRRIRSAKSGADTLDLVSGVDKFTAEFVDNHKAIKIQLHLTAPYLMTEELKETVYLENYCP
jgi:prepilin-type N-terminal cleavage/methylation domain-containing protein